MIESSEPKEIQDEVEAFSRGTVIQILRGFAGSGAGERTIGEISWGNGVPEQSFCLWRQNLAGWRISP
jgi:hypothetical protein